MQILGRCLRNGHPFLCEGGYTPRPRSEAGRHVKHATTGAVSPTNNAGNDIRWSRSYWDAAAENSSSPQACFQACS